MNYLVSISYCWYLEKKLVITTNLTNRECAPDKSLVRQLNYGKIVWKLVS